MWETLKNWVARIFTGSPQVSVSLPHPYRTAPLTPPETPPTKLWIRKKKVWRCSQVLDFVKGTRYYDYGDYLCPFLHEPLYGGDGPPCINCTRK